MDFTHILVVLVSHLEVLLKIGMACNSLQKKMAKYSYHPYPQGMKIQGLGLGMVEIVLQEE